MLKPALVLCGSLLVLSSCLAGPKPPPGVGDASEIGREIDAPIIRYYMLSDI